jgi:hypothetical protein
VHNQGIELFEGARVYQQGDTFAGGKLAAGVLGVDAALAATERGLLFTASEIL